MRRALLVGEEVPKQNASGNSLLGPQQPAKYDFEQMRKSYWQSMETYKAELAQKQQAAADQTSPEMRAYPQQQDPRPGADDRKPGDETQVAFAPAAAVAAPVVIEGAAAASAAALAYWTDTWAGKGPSTLPTAAALLNQKVKKIHNPVH
ncbi:MAG: hypothetical protein HQL45_02515 [Alphaproteobacteria bacterium]|nr:hypothetical protein [Alphaproteobacteria bacterium]